MTVLADDGTAPDRDKAPVIQTTSSSRTVASPGLRWTETTAVPPKAPTMSLKLDVVQSETLVTIAIHLAVRNGNTSKRALSQSNSPCLTTRKALIQLRATP